MYQRIVLAYDGSEAGQKAIMDCDEIAHWTHAMVFLVATMAIPSIDFVGLEGVMGNPQVDRIEKERAQDVLADGLNRLNSQGYEASAELLVGDLVTEITDFARKVNADLIIVGHKHATSWATRWWRSAQSGALIEKSSCSVLIAITN
jgi:nucleotide-binding universal stress UspA family protein